MKQFPLFLFFIVSLFFMALPASAESGAQTCAELPPDMSLPRVIGEIHTIKRGDTLFRIAKEYGDEVANIMEQNRLASDIILPGNTLAVTRKIEERETLVSWYGEPFHGKTMANGKRFNMHNPQIVAHKRLPLGTRVMFRNPENGNTVEAVVRDRGPYVGKREFDLSYAGARELDIVDDGVAKVMVLVVCIPKA